MEIENEEKYEDEVENEEMFKNTKNP